MRVIPVVRGEGGRLVAERGYENHKNSHCTKVLLDIEIDVQQNFVKGGEGMCLGGQFTLERQNGRFFFCRSPNLDTALAKSRTGVQQNLG